eukprot:scaffold22747_cov129-Isochrysis_galbana.AAC.2
MPENCPDALTEKKSPDPVLDRLVHVVLGVRLDDEEAGKLWVAVEVCRVDRLLYPGDLGGHGRGPGADDPRRGRHKTRAQPADPRTRSLAIALLVALARIVVPHGTAHVLDRLAHRLAHRATAAVPAVLRPFTAHHATRVHAVTTLHAVDSTSAALAASPSTA